MTTHPESDFDAPAVPVLPPPQPRLPTLPAATPKAPPAPAAPLQMPVSFVPTRTVAATRPKRRRWSSVALVLVLLLGVGTAVYLLVLRESDDTGDAATTDPTAQPEALASAAADGLPDLRFDRPALTSATWTDTLSELQLDDVGTVQVVTSSVNSVADFSGSVARFDFTTNGPAGPGTYIVTPDYAYWPSDVDGEPWTRERNADEPSPDAPFDSQFLDVYDDMVTEQMRAHATNVTTTTSAAAGSTRTTYAFDVQATDITGDVRDEFPAIDDLRDMVGHMELSIDAAGLVQHWSFTLDETVMRSALAADPTARSMPFTFGRDIISTNQPVDIVLPTDFVDQLSESCRVEQKTLQVATEAWYAQYGDATPPTEAQLVTDGMIRVEFDGYDLVDGAIVAAPGGPCE